LKEISSSGSLGVELKEDGGGGINLGIM